VELAMSRCACGAEGVLARAGSDELRELRDRCPIHYEPALDMWLVTRFETVASVLRDTDTFSSRHAVTTCIAPLPPEVAAELDGPWPTRMLTETDDPRHRSLRRVFQDGFTPRRLSGLAPGIEDMASALVHGFAADGRAELIAAFAWPLPLGVLGRLLGLPPSSDPQVHDWSRHFLLLLDQHGDPGELREHAAAVRAMRGFLEAELRERHARPREDLLTAIMLVAADEDVDTAELAELAIGLVAAGHLTTTRAIGSAVWRLLEDAELLAAVRGEPAALEAFVEELLRVDSPTQGLFRTVRRDTVLDGVSLAAGSRVMVHFGSANRDERVFDEPDRLDLSRPALTRHLAFGRGAHFCLGAPLARLELPIALRILLDRLPGLRLAAEAPAVADPVFIARGFSSLTVEWDPRLCVGATAP
jgi:cytochrome P450